MERDFRRRCKRTYIIYFNSHAHVERDAILNTFIYGCDISTHTLTWSVTLKTYSVLNHSKNFNSHAHVERDFPLQFVLYHLCNFNSHAHVERDYCYHCNTVIIIIFQLTRSRGAWLVKAIANIILIDFNSHAHVERDITKSPRNC